jgi:transcriptional regulator with XRE-family HTH domain
LDIIETNSFGEYLSALRAVHKIKIYKLAGLADVDPVTIRNIEHGRKDATPQQQERLLNAIRMLHKQGK